jgi:hypothetical protein
VRRLVLIAPLLPLAVLLAGCGGSADDSSSTPTATPSAPASSGPASSGSSSTASAAAAAFNPCDSLSAKKVSRALGAPVRITKGTADTPRCGLLPKKKNDPTFELSYLWFDGGLEAAWKTMDVGAGTVTSPKVAGADDARQVVQRTTSAYAVSAFLQNGSLIQSLNALAPAPYHARAIQRATAEILAELSAGAPQS